VSGDHAERLRRFLGAHRPDRERKSADVIATLPNPDGPGWRHLTGADLRAALDELVQLRALQIEVGETEVEWGYWHEDEFIVSERQLSAGDVRYYREQSGRPVERRLAGQWREVPNA